MDISWKMQIIVPNRSSLSGLAVGLTDIDCIGEYDAQILIFNDYYEEDSDQSDSVLNNSFQYK